MHPTEHCYQKLQKLTEVTRQTQVAFRKTGKKSLIFEFVMMYSTAIFDFHQNFASAIKYKHLGIFGENFVQFGRDLRLWRKKTATLLLFFHYSIM